MFSGFYAAARLPFQLAATLIKRLVQIIFSIFIVILHPGFKWLLALLTRSRIVRDYVRPVLQQLGSCLYEPYSFVDFATTRLRALSALRW